MNIWGSEQSFWGSSSINNNFDGFNGLTGLLGDHAAIRNGSYRKLVTAYNKQQNGEDTSAVAKNRRSIDTEETISSVRAAAENLRSAADAFSGRGDNSLFALKDVTTTDENGVETTTKDFDRDAIFKAMQNFVNAYNEMLDAAGKSENRAITNAATNMVGQAIASGRMLSDIGITLDTDGKMSLDETKFREADMTTVRSMFEGPISFASGIATRASTIATQAANDAARSTGLYNFKGGHVGSIGNVFNSAF